MKSNILSTIAMLALVATFQSSASAADTAAQPSADAILKQMSDTLATAKQFKFTVHRELNEAFAKQHGLQQDAQIEVAVKRPDKMVARSSGSGDVRNVYADGKEFSIHDALQDVYSTIPALFSLDELPAMLATKYGFAPPLSEFVVSNPYKEIMFRSQSISYAGVGAIHGGFMGLSSTKCHRLALSGKLADAELWIGVDDHLPKKLVATFKGDAEQGKLSLTFSKWNTAANISDQEFVFTPSKAAMKAPMMTVSEIQEAWKK